MKTIKKKETVEVKGIKLDVELTYYYDEENDLLFDDEELGNKNLGIIRNAYRKETGLLTDKEIKQIREQYNLNQRNFALILGFGEVTITRYESKMIQDNAHDAVIRSAKDPNVFINYINKNRDLYLKYNTEEALDNLIKIVKDKISGNLSLSGNIEFNENKFLATIKYIKSKIEFLTKTKLAKLLWYTDFKYYKDYNSSITGLTYIHNFYGAYPVGYNDKLSNNNIVIREEYDSITDESKYFIVSCKTKYELNKEEENIIDLVVSKLGYLKTKDLVEYMHQEDAYTKTKQNEIIKYDFAKTLSI